MSKGFWAGDAIAQGITNVGLASDYERAVDDRIALRKRMEAEYEALAHGNAANVAEKMALRVALAKLDPKHPLLTNAHLRERLHKAAQQVYALSDSSWIDVGNVGRDFKY